MGDTPSNRVFPRASLTHSPPELLTEVLVSLDLRTLTSFRRVNHRAMSLVDSLHQYATVLRHCPDVIRAIISVRAGSFSCRTLYEALSADRCHTCKRFGAYLYLITCKRACYFCFTQHLDYFPVSATQAAQSTGLSRGELKGLPHILSLSGRYTAKGKLLKQRTLLFDRKAVICRASETSAQAFDEATRRRDLTTREPRRYASIISAPYLLSSGRSADWGFYCSACRDDKNPATHFRNKLTKDDMLKHIRWHKMRGMAIR